MLIRATTKYKKGHNIKLPATGDNSSGREPFSFLGSGFNFLPVFEGEADVVGRVDGAEVNQPVPALQREFGQLIRHGCKGFQEILNAGPLGLHLMDFICDRVQSGLGLLEPFGQAVVAFLVFGLVEGNMGIFLDALLNHIGDHLRLLLEFLLLPL